MEETGFTLKGFLGICAKSCQRNRCKDKCSGWFPNDIQLRDGCKAACVNDYKILNSPEDYLCSGRYVSEEELILSRQYDPCPESGIGIQDMLQPWDFGNNDQKVNPEKVFDMKKGLAIGVIILLAFLGLVVAFSNNKK